MEVILILGILIVALVAYVIAIYNRLVSRRVNVNEAWSDIGVQMKRRYDLVPNLVETVKGYAGHEKSTLDAVIKARAAAVANEGTPAEQAQSENMLTGALKSLFAVAEAYPDLKANENFRDLQAQLAEIEEHIQRARRFYNGNVREMNTMVGQFPSNLVARQFNFTKAEFFEIDEESTAVPAVEF